MHLQFQYKSFSYHQLVLSFEENFPTQNYFSSKSTRMIKPFLPPFNIISLYIRNFAFFLFARTVLIKNFLLVLYVVGKERKEGRKHRQLDKREEYRGRNHSGIHFAEYFIQVRIGEGF